MDKTIREKLLQTVEQNYRDIALHYNETRKKKLGPAWSALVRLAAAVPPGARVLDVGCGNGRLIEVFAGKKIDYLGLDLCAELIEKAREQKPGYRFAAGNVFELDKLAEKDFDHVFSVALIHHLPGIESRLAALAQMKSKLKKGGRLILSAWDLRARPRFRRLILKHNLKKLVGRNKMDFNDILFPWKNAAGEIVSERYYHAFSSRELGRMANQAGLEITELFCENYNYYLVAKKP